MLLLIRKYKRKKKTEREREGEGGGGRGRGRGPPLSHSCTDPAMGVTGLWPLLEPVGRRINVEALSNKRLAIGVWRAGKGRRREAGRRGRRISPRLRRTASLGPRTCGRLCASGSPPRPHRAGWRARFATCTGGLTRPECAPDQRSMVGGQLTAHAFFFSPSSAARPLTSLSLYLRVQTLPSGSTRL